LNQFIAVLQVPEFVGRQIGCWRTSWRQSASAVRAELDLVTAGLIVYPALCKGEELGGHEIAHVAMHHIHPRCLSHPTTYIMLQCHPQMSGTDSGPSAATAKGEARENKRQRERQRIRVEEARKATEGAGATDMAGSSGVGQVLMIRFVLDCFNSRLLMACATGHASCRESENGQGTRKMGEIAQRKRS
jgi:hypothetical protein